MKTQCPGLRITQFSYATFFRKKRYCSTSISFSRGKAFKEQFNQHYHILHVLILTKNLIIIKKTSNKILNHAAGLKVLKTIGGCEGRAWL